MKPPYNKVYLQERASRVLISWLNSVEIPAEPGDMDLVDVYLQTKDSAPVFVQFIGIPQKADRKPPTGKGVAVFIDAKAMTSTRLEKALPIFSGLTEALGYGRMVPALRKQTGVTRLNSKDNFDLISFRHREFRAVPNPPDGAIEQYESVIHTTCTSFLKKFPFLRWIGFEVEDLKTYGRVWATIFVGRHAVSDPTQGGNEHLFVRNLKIRLYDLAQRAMKTPGHQYGALPLWRKNSETLLKSISGPWPNWLDEEDEPEVESKAMSKKAAKKELARRLSEMPHDRMVESLKGISETARYLSPDVVEEARKQLRLHQRACNLCKALKVNEDARRADSDGAVEAI